MPKDTFDAEIPSNDTRSLPQFPGEDFLAHAGTQWLEKAEARLAAMSLLVVAQGHDPPAARCIVDVDLSALLQILLPLSSVMPDYHA